MGGKGLLIKIAGVTTLAVVGLASAVLTVTPKPEPVGGQSTGTLRLTISHPGKLTGYPNMPDGPDPGLFNRVTFTFTPARVRPGTRLRVIEHKERSAISDREYHPDGTYHCLPQNSKKHVGNDYLLGIGNILFQERVWLYRVPPAKASRPPTTAGFPLAAQERGQGSQKASVDHTRCAEGIALVTTWDVAVPSDLRPGRYLLSTIDQPGVPDVEINNSSVPPATVGAKIDGQLAQITVMHAR